VLFPSPPFVPARVTTRVGCFGDISSVS
jgi:hypothetical protein